MNPHDIISSLKKMGKTQTGIANDLGITPCVVSHAIHGRITSYRVAIHIAGLLKKSVDELWPGKYVFRPRKRVRDRESSALNLSSL